MAELGNVTPDIQLPLNASEQRSSAHYQEIAFKYNVGMGRIFWKKYGEIAEERKSRDVQERTMEFARPGYKFAERKER